LSRPTPGPTPGSTPFGVARFINCCPRNFVHILTLPQTPSYLYLYLYGITGRLRVIACNYFWVWYNLGMATDTWTPLWSKIVDSSVWSEDDVVRIVFITMLAKKDSDHIVRGSAYQIGRWANKGEADVLKALKVLASPDKKRLEPQPHNGRRIEKVEDGWLMLNGEEYRLKVSEEMRKARLRRAQNTYRAKHLTSGTPLKGEVKAVKDFGDGRVDKNFMPIAEKGTCL